MGNAELAVLYVPLAAGAILELADTIGRYGDVVRTWPGILLISRAKVFGILCAVAIVTFRTNEQWLIGMSVVVAVFLLYLWLGKGGGRVVLADGSALRENVAIRNVVSTMSTRPSFGVLTRKSSPTAPRVSIAAVMTLPDVIVTEDALAVLTPGELQAVVARQLVWKGTSLTSRILSASIAVVVMLRIVFWPQGPIGASMAGGVAIASGVLSATMLVLWRRAEYEADRQAAHLLSGAEGLAGALHRLDQIDGGGWSKLRPAVAGRVSRLGMY